MDHPCSGSRSAHRTLFIYLIATLLSFGCALQVQAQSPIGELSWVVKIFVTDREAITELSRDYDVWSVHRDEGYIVAQVTSHQRQALHARGWQVDLDEAWTEKLREQGQALTFQLRGIPGYPCYRTVEETFTAARLIVKDHPDLATWLDIGDSWNKTQDASSGYDLQVLKLTQSKVSGPKPVFFATFAIHAREYTTAELGTRFAEFLVESYGVDADVTWLLDYHEVHLLLQANPDGRKRAEAGLYWRKNVDNNACANSARRGVDLNRNFAFRWACCGGSSSSQCSSTFHGTGPSSEPETLAVQDYAGMIFPDQRPADPKVPAPADATGVYVDVHSYSELVLWPWGYTTSPAPNAAALQTFGRKIAAFNEYTPQQSTELYITDGTTDDFVYGELGVASYTFELGTAFFQSCLTFQDSILPDNLQALLYMAKSARAPYQTPAGPDAIDVSIPDQRFQPGDLVSLTATVDDTRFNNSNGTEPTQDIAAAEYFMDVPPWESGAIPLPMSASDGSFNESIEGVEATVDTAGLSIGRHTVFVRGQDADGNWGVVSAAFLDLTDPNASDPPTVTITAPSDGSQFSVHSRITFKGTASDGEDGDLSANLTWSSSIDGPIGSGTLLSITSLSAGSHTITASAKDSSLLIGSDQVTIEVKSACLPKGAACATDRDCCTNKCSGKFGRKNCK